MDLLPTDLTGSLFNCVEIFVGVIVVQIIPLVMVIQVKLLIGCVTVTATSLPLTRLFSEAYTKPAPLNNFCNTVGYCTVVLC